MLHSWWIFAHLGEPCCRPLPHGKVARSLLLAVAMKMLAEWSLLLLTLTICGCGGELRGSESSIGGAKEVPTAPDDSAAAGGGVSATATVVPSTVCAPRRTTAVKIEGNLDSSSWIPSIGWNLLDPMNTANFSDTLTLFDDAQTPITCDVYFRKESENVWTYHVIFDYDTTPVECGSGELQYDKTGALLRNVEFTVMRFPPTSQSTGLVIAIDLGGALEAGQSGLDGLTQRPIPSSVSDHWQDGQTEITGEYCRAREQEAAGG